MEFRSEFNGCEHRTSTKHHLHMYIFSTDVSSQPTRTYYDSRIQELFFLCILTSVKNPLMGKCDRVPVSTSKTADVERSDTKALLRKN